MLLKPDYDLYKVIKIICTSLTDGIKVLETKYISIVEYNGIVAEKKM